VDGQEIRRDTDATATAFAQNASAGMTIHLNVWPGNADFGGNIDNTTLPVRQYISWVQYSSYDNDNDNFNVQWREEFQSSGIPSGWAVGYWSSPYNLSMHKAKNVGFVNGIAVLSLTADNDTGNVGTPPADTSAGGASGLGGSSGSGGSGGSIGEGGSTSVGGTTSSAGTTITGGTPSGGVAGTGGTTANGVAPSGGSSDTNTQGGCSCNTVHTASSIRAALVGLVLFLIVSRPRRKKN
jgi:hypothetical protein